MPTYIPSKMALSLLFLLCHKDIISNSLKLELLSGTLMSLMGIFIFLLLGGRYFLTASVSSHGDDNQQFP